MPRLARTLLAFAALPGVVAFAIPAALAAALAPPARAAAAAGLFVGGLGLAGLLGCVRDFHIAGLGTLAPWWPATRLVTIGLYRRSRNPMYLCVVTILLGWTIAFQALPLALYAAGVAVAFHLRVVFGEEPWLRRTMGPAWADYAARVPRWL